MWSWGDNDLIIEAADRLAIDQLCVSIPVTRGMPSMEEVRTCNDGVLEAMRRYRDRILGYCYVCPGYSEADDEIDRCLDRGMIGIKLYNQYKICDPAVRPTLEKAIRERVPILEHAGYPSTLESWAAQPQRVAVRVGAEQLVRVAHLAELGAAPRKLAVAEPQHGHGVGTGSGRSGNYDRRRAFT